MRLAVLLACLTGCNWITSADVAAEKKTLDEDGDGFVASEDCDDEAANVYPGAEDAWYDGIDSDCAGDNDNDQDGDGIVASADCVDTDASIYPAAADPWYDGVDTDCGGDDDFDQDGDGYVANEHIGAVTSNIPGSGGLDGGDCDDTEVSVHPGAGDAKYDGVDADCAGNDDYDLDGDGHVPEEYDGSVTRYVDGSGLLPADDCDDTDAESYPGATEIWYDGVDQDCAGGNDYDQDGDGWVENRYLPEPDNDLPGGECNDLDPSIHPGGVETLGDGAVDGDCDGDASGATLVAVDGLDFADGHNPVLVDDGDSLYLSVVSSQVRFGEEDWYQAGVAVSWAIAAIDNDDSAFEVLKWNSAEDAEYIVTGAHAALLDDGHFYAGVGLVQSGVRKIYMVHYDDAGSVVGSMNAAPSSSLTDIDDLTMVVDPGGAVYAMGCAAGQGANWMYLDALDAIAEPPTRDDVLDDVTARACALDVRSASDATLVYSDGLNVWDWDFNPGGTTLDGTNGAHTSGVVLDVDVLSTSTTTWRVLAASSFGGVRLQADSGEEWTVGEVGDGPTDADADLDAAGSGVVAWINDDGSIRLAVGSVLGWDYYDIETDLSVDNVAVREVDGTIIVAAAGNGGLGVAILRP